MKKKRQKKKKKKKKQNKWARREDFRPGQIDLLDLG